ncbi:IS1096 element passenger TnpR family protein, partial [Enterobacter cloacae]|uniref:IS1096 element passenger TnpR family protein n=1 Tax=Enterobacter cloacae TaxID=550 RepID=UPI003D9C7FB3
MMLTSGGSAFMAVMMYRITGLPGIIMKIYVIKIAVHGVSPMVWRRLRIAADTSLAALHFIFQIVQGW